MIELQANYFVGHSHKQFRYEYDKFILVNPGSVGQNRQFINRIDYATWNTENQKIELKNIIYDVNIVINKMKEYKYPEVCIEYYESKPKI